MSHKIKSLKKAELDVVLLVFNPITLRLRHEETYELKTSLVYIASCYLLAKAIYRDPVSKQANKPLRYNLQTTILNSVMTECK